MSTAENAVSKKLKRCLVNVHRRFLEHSIYLVKLLVFMRSYKKLTCIPPVRTEYTMNNKNSYNMILVGFDILSLFSILIFIAVPWAFYRAAMLGPQSFSNALSGLTPIIYFDSIPFCAGLCWLVRRYGARIDQSLPSFMRSYWLGLLIFTCIAVPVLLLKFRR